MATEQEDDDVADSLPCVLDNGSDLSTIEFGEKHEPSSVFDTIVGRFQYIGDREDPLE